MDLKTKNIWYGDQALKIADLEGPSVKCGTRLSNRNRQLNINLKLKFDCRFVRSRPEIYSSLLLIFLLKNFPITSDPRTSSSTLNRNATTDSATYILYTSSLTTPIVPELRNDSK